MRRREHRATEQWVFGRAYRPVVDALLDTPWELREFQDKHRKVSHTWERLEAIRTLLGDEAWLQALLHVMLDYDAAPPGLSRVVKTTRFRSRPI